MNQKKLIVHATNIYGLGASSVAISLINAFNKNNETIIKEYILPGEGSLKQNLPKELKINEYNRYLPKFLSRFLECFISPLFFDKSLNYIILGDIPLYGICNQVVLVHQPNLVYPKINVNSSKSLSFKVNRFLFKRNLRFTKRIIVQTSVMETELIASYPKLKEKIVVVPQPVPDGFNTVEKFHWEMKKKDKLKLFYPSAGYPHKNHDFLLKVAEEINEKKISFKIYLTLEEAEFEKFGDIPFIENLGRIPAEKMKETYLNFDSLLFISKAESYGLPLVEAMSIGMPIVTIDLAYSKWMCEENAFYFEEDNVESFIHAIQDLSKLEMDNVNYSKQLIKFPSNWNKVAEKFIENFV
jgi:glycosyltransferase involved in cell wall biosynthesis